MDRVKALEEYVKTLEGLIDEADVAGTRYEKTGTALNIASDTSWHTVSADDLERITLFAGTWVLHGWSRTPSDADGRRALCIYDVTNAARLPLSLQNKNAVNGALHNMQTMTTITVTDDTVITLQVQQNSGATCNIEVGIEAVLIASEAEVEGSGGATSYNELSNKPQIEGVTLVGDKSFDDLGLVVPTKISDLTNDSDFVEDASYVHTDNNYTSTEKTKLSGIASGAEVNVQSDWNQTNTSADDYIKNKPTIPSKVSDLTNDSGFITTETDPTVPSWAKTSSKPTYTASEVGALPSTTAIPSKTSDLTNDSGFITGYTETDPVFTASVAHGISSSDISTWNGKSTVSVNRKTTSGTNIADLTINGTTTQLYAPTSGGGGGGTITEVKTTAGAHQTIDISSGVVEFSVPTNTNHLTNGAGFITSETDPVFSASAASGITSSDISTWNGKSDFSGSYNDLTNKPTIPSKTSDLTNDSGFITTETDPTVPSWAKASTKPAYTASEVGALPDTTTIPANTSDLNNDSGFISADSSGNVSLSGSITAEGNDSPIGYRPTRQTGSYSLASGTSWVTVPASGLARTTLSKGTWIIQAQAIFASNSTGWRGLRIYDVTTSENIGRSGVTQPAVNGATTNMTTMAIISLTESNTFTLQLVQNSGGARNVDLQFHAVRIA